MYTILTGEQCISIPHHFSYFSVVSQERHRRRTLDATSLQYLPGSIAKSTEVGSKKDQSASRYMYLSGTIKTMAGSPVYQVGNGKETEQQHKLIHCRLDRVDAGRSKFNKW